MRFCIDVETSNAYSDVPERFGATFKEVLPLTKWNYGIMDFDPLKTEDVFQVIPVINE